jgi:hypothetical protein
MSINELLRNVPAIVKNVETSPLLWRMEFHNKALLGEEKKDICT